MFSNSFVKKLVYVTSVYCILSIENSHSMSLPPRNAMHDQLVVSSMKSPHTFYRSPKPLHTSPLTEESLVSAACIIAESGTAIIEPLIELLCREDLTFSVADKAYWAFIWEMKDKTEKDEESFAKVSTLLETVKSRKQAKQRITKESLLSEYNSEAFGTLVFDGPEDEYDP